MTSPARYEGDLRLTTLVREVTRAWDHDPVSARLWKKARGWVILLCTTTICTNLLSLILIFPAVNTALFVTRSLASILGPIIVLCNFSSAGLILAVHFLYPRWAYRRAWREDDMLKLVDISPRQRFIGMMAPFIRGWLVLIMVGVLINLLQFALGTVMSSLAGGHTFLDATWYSAVFVITSVTNYLFEGVVPAMIASTLGLRLATAYASARGRASFPYWKSILGWVLLTVLSGIVISTATWLREDVARRITTPIERERVARSFGYFDTQFITPDQAFGVAMIFHCIWTIGTGLLIVFLTHRVLIAIWRRDIPIARQFLFQEDADEVLPQVSKMSLDPPSPSIPPVP